MEFVIFRGAWTEAKFDGDNILRLEDNDWVCSGFSALGLLVGWSIPGLRNQSDKLCGVLLYLLLDNS